MSNLYAKNFSDADEVKTPPKARVEVVKLNNVNASKLVLEPGWKWSTCIKPTVGGDSCQAGHVGVVISGSMTVKHDDGSEITVGAGDAYYFAPGHDGWVNGDEQCIVYEIVEGGKSISLGFEYERRNQNNDKIYSLSFANSISDRVNDNLPSKTKLNEERTDLVGKFSYYPNQVLNFDYSFFVIRMEVTI